MPNEKKTILAFRDYIKPCGISMQRVLDNFK
jgi:hypothetical protein